MTLNKKDKEKIISMVKDILQKDDSVIFGYLYGSFIHESSFNDIDIFVHLREPCNFFAYPVSLKERLLENLHGTGLDIFIIDVFDVRIINDCPYDFLINILRDGQLVADKDPDYRTDVIEHVSNEYRVNHFILDEAYQ